MDNLFYEQLESESEYSPSKTLYEELKNHINKEIIKTVNCFNDTMDKDYKFFYHGMYIAYQNVLTILINLKERR